jgi:hypothetical protein
LFNRLKDEQQYITLEYVRNQVKISKRAFGKMMADRCKEAQKKK